MSILTKQGQEKGQERRSVTGTRIIKCCHLLVVDDDDVSTKRQFLLSVHCVGKEEGKLDYYSQGAPFHSPCQNIASLSRTLAKFLLTGT